MIDKLTALPHWQDVDQRLAQEQAIAAKQYDDANNELAQLHTRLSLHDGAMDASIKKHESYVESMLTGTSGLTPHIARHCKGYQKALANRYQHNAAKRLAFPATQRSSGQSPGEPIG